jgi:hypothetical protein
VIPAITKYKRRLARRTCSIYPGGEAEAARLVRATQNKLWSSDKIDHPDYREPTLRVSSALAMIEASYVEARRRSERAE